MKKCMFTLLAVVGALVAAQAQTGTQTSPNSGELRQVTIQRNYETKQRNDYNQQAAKSTQQSMSNTNTGGGNNPRPANVYDGNRNAGKTPSSPNATRQ